MLNSLPLSIRNRTTPHTPMFGAKKFKFEFGAKIWIQMYTFRYVPQVEPGTWASVRMEIEIVGCRLQKNSNSNLAPLKINLIGHNDHPWPYRDIENRFRSLGFTIAKNGKISETHGIIPAGNSQFFAKSKNGFRSARRPNWGKPLYGEDATM